MELKLIRHTWGTRGTWEELFPSFQAAGYHGVETGVPAAPDRTRLLDCLAEQGFLLVLQIASAGSSIDDHLASFERQLHEACACRPVLINSHSGRDAWPEDQAARFFSKVLELEQASGVPVVHETHRSRVLYNPWTTHRLLAALPELKLCCDFSHWACVSESLLEDQGEIIRHCAGRCHHLHARVGHEQGPQVSDPRAPEHHRHLAAHEAWWHIVWDAQQARGDETTTLVPEFGPPPYAPVVPGTNTPLRDVTGICDWMARRQMRNFIDRSTPAKR